MCKLDGELSWCEIHEGGGGKKEWLCSLGFRKLGCFRKMLEEFSVEKKALVCKPGEKFDWCEDLEVEGRKKELLCSPGLRKLGCSVKSWRKGWRQKERVIVQSRFEKAWLFCKILEERLEAERKSGWAGQVLGSLVVSVKFRKSWWKGRLGKAWLFS